MTAPVCSTWVLLNRGTSKRSKHFPLGDQTVPSVRIGNKMVSRTILALLLCQIRRIWWVLEQPQGSLMESHPRFRWMLKRLRVYRVRICMSWFGASSEKPTWLYSNWKFIEEIVKYAKPTDLGNLGKKSLAIKYKDASGQTRVVGGPDLKSSQAYPKGFGTALCAVYQDHMMELRRWAADVPEHPSRSMTDLFSDAGNAWPDAGLRGVLRYLCKP